MYGSHYGSTCRVMLNYFLVGQCPEYMLRSFINSKFDSPVENIHLF